MEKSQGLTIISIIVGLLMVALLVFLTITYFMARNTRESAEITTPIERAKSVECLAQIRRVKTAIEMYAIEHSEFPLKLDDLEDLSDEDLACPVTHNPYKYEPRTGRVTCPDHSR